MINSLTMAISILLVTPQPEFGAMIARELDASRYSVLFTADFSEALQHLRQSNCTLILLDADLEDDGISLLELSMALSELQDDLIFLLLKHPEQDLYDEEALNLAATLNKPVSMAVLKDQLDKLTSSPTRGAFMSEFPTSLPEYDAQVRNLAETSRLVWVKDVSKAAQHLTRLTLESSAQAALITRDGELWAYAGQLSREAAQELSESVQRYWDRESDSDILRFLRLQATEAQHILYARKLSASMILALVFDGETSFSTIRAQAGKLVKNLSDSASAESTPPFAIPASIGDDFAPDEPETEDLPPFAELLGDVPPPIPPAAKPATHISLPWEQTQPVVTPFVPPAPDRRFTSQANSPTPARSAQKRPLPAMDETMAMNIAPPSAPAAKNLPPTARPAVTPEVQQTRPQQPQDQVLAETRPQVSPEAGSTTGPYRILLEPASPAIADLAYACLLIPRFESHHLVGDAAERLGEWVPHVCIAYGWRLEHFAVRPDYMQWIVRVLPSTAPGSIMRIVRQQTSERLLNEFPRLKKENPSGDFWAPGYLLMGSSQPHPQNLVRTFIKQIRDRQGLSSAE